MRIFLFLLFLAAGPERRVLKINAPKSPKRGSVQ